MYDITLVIKFKAKEIIMDNKSNFNVKDERNLTMLVDFYELTMANGYFPITSFGVSK